MIKELIQVILQEEVTLSQALTKAKVIAYQLKNDELKNWLYKEISGYGSDDLPSYRKIPCETFADVRNYMGTQKTIPCNLKVVIGQEKSEYFFNEIRVPHDIRAIEFTLNQNSDKTYGFEYLPDHLCSQMDVVEDVFVTKVKRRFQFSHLRYVLETTRQKLLDTLLELNDAFPNLENEFVITKESTDRINQIVNNYINGDNNPVNVAAGHTVEINSTVNYFSTAEEKELTALGVEENDISELKKIISDKAQSKESKNTKIMKWLGSVSASVASRGLSDNIPKLIDFIGNLIY